VSSGKGVAETLKIKSLKLKIKDKNLTKLYLKSHPYKLEFVGMTFKRIEDSVEVV